MKEKIYTIPINDAYRSASSCPLCELAEIVQDNTLTYFLGASLMDPDVRKSTNSTGFCGHHLTKLYSAEINRLGLGLMIHTYLNDLKSDIGEVMQGIASASGAFHKSRSPDYTRNLESAADRIDSRLDSCLICQKISYTMDRYLDVLLWMFFEDADFRSLFESGHKHCLHHTAFLLRGAAKILTKGQALSFVQILAAQQSRGMEELAADIEWFTQKFDYRNNDKPWGNSKNAIPRAISFLYGKGDTDDDP